MPQEVQLPDGRILVIPDNITLDQRAALRNKLGSQYADIKTGRGMEERSQQQSHQSFTGAGNDPSGQYDASGRRISGPNGQPLTLMDRAAQSQDEQQATLGSRINAAAKSPTPMTDATAVYTPTTTARSILGAKVGGKIGSHFGPYGELAGGAIGGVGAGVGPPLASRISKIGIQLPKDITLPGGVKITNVSPGPVLGSADNPGLTSKIPTGRSSMPKVGRYAVPYLTDTAYDSPAGPPLETQTGSSGSSRPPSGPPLRPVIGSEGDWQEYDRQMNILRPEAEDAGTYHAARGSVNKKTNLQQRMEKRFKQ